MEIQDWKKLVDTEISHWNHVFYKYTTDPNSYLHQYIKKRLDMELPLHQNVQSLVDSIDKPEISILDVGSGPVPFLGRNSTKNIKLTAADYLAENYYELYNRYNLYPPTIPIPLDASELSLHFQKNYFDIVYARNSIDHTFDPIRSIQEMVNVSNKYVILEHKMNEGMVESYQGLHNWNFFIKDSKFYISNKIGDVFCMNDFLPNLKIECQLTIEEEENINDWLVIVISQNKLENL
jgi:SAM-dependent methyltransferase